MGVLIKNAEVQDLPVDPQKPDEARVMVTIPFYGISGLTSFFLDDQEMSVFLYDGRNCQISWQHRGTGELQIPSWRNSISTSLACQISSNIFP